MAIEQGDRLAVIRALDNGADIEEADMHGVPGLPLRMACFDGHLEIVAELIRRGAKVAGHRQSGGPMRLATRGQHHDIVRLLLDHGAKTPDDIKLPGATPRDRRHRGERRKRKAIPYLGDRRGPEDRRATSVEEVELSADQWATYFADLPALIKARPDDDFDETASNVLARVRD